MHFLQSFEKEFVNFGQFPLQMSTGGSLDDPESLALVPSGQKSLVLAESYWSCGDEAGTGRDQQFTARSASLIFLPTTGDHAGARLAGIMLDPAIKPLLVV